MQVFSGRTEIIAGFTNKLRMHENGTRWCPSSLAELVNTPISRLSYFIVIMIHISYISN